MSTQERQRRPSPHPTSPLAIKLYPLSSRGAASQASCSHKPLLLEPSASGWILSVLRQTGLVLFGAPGTPAICFRTYPGPSSVPTVPWVPRPVLPGLASVSSRGASLCHCYDAQITQDHGCQRALKSYMDFVFKREPGCFSLRVSGPLWP